VTDEAKKKLAESIGGFISKAISTEEAQEEKQDQPSAEEITKSVTEGVMANLSAHPFFKALEGVQKSDEADPNDEMKKYLRRYVRKSIEEASQVLSVEIIKGVRESVMEMFGGEDQITKLNKIGKKLQVVGAKKSQKPAADIDEDDDPDEDDENVEKQFKKRGEGRGRFAKKGTTEQLDKALGSMARGAMKG